MATFHQQRNPLNPHQLSWEEVDPRRHEFDRSTVLDVLNALPPAADVPPPQGDHAGNPDWQQWSDDLGVPWTDDIGQAIIDHYGVWACGWQWGRGESDWDGGPVSSWCCAGHSITTPGETIRAAAAGLIEWRDWLERLEMAFDDLLPISVDIADSAVLDEWERAAARLITMVVIQTAGESAWYGHCEQVLSWFVSAAGVDAARARNLVEKATDGRFGSWTDPSSEYPGIGRALVELIPRNRTE